MAEEIQTAELAKTQITNQGILANLKFTRKIKILKRTCCSKINSCYDYLICNIHRFSFFISFREPSRTTLFSALPEHEKSRVMDVFRANGIDVSIDRTTGEILVPSPEYYEAKMKLLLRVSKLCSSRI